MICYKDIALPYILEYVKREARVHKKLNESCKMGNKILDTFCPMPVQNRNTATG
jgi:hypothetical protein